MVIPSDIPGGCGQQKCISCPGIINCPRLIQCAICNNGQSAPSTIDDSNVCPVRTCRPCQECALVKCSCGAGPLNDRGCPTCAPCVPPPACPKIGCLCGSNGLDKNGCPICAPCKPCASLACVCASSRNVIDENGCHIGCGPCDILVDSTIQ